MLNRKETITDSLKQSFHNRGRLIVSCQDQTGIVAKISTFLYEQGANIMESNQYTTDFEEGRFFLRIEFYLDGLAEKKAQLEAAFETIAAELQLKHKFRYPAELNRIAIFASQSQHCLLELLWEWQAGELVGDIACVVANHEHIREIVEPFGIPFYYTPVTKETKVDVEREQIALMQQLEIDTIVLARYMQILTPAFIEAFPQQIINIHHSFLPAFIGANPYGRAFDRGVKLIGATSHYVTTDLDEGPIIEQDVYRVNHQYSAEDLRKAGRVVEKTVLARALKWHLQDRVFVYGNKTVIFN